eukprot:EG_transcript_20412
MCSLAWWRRDSLPRDWLAEHQERGQTLKQFLATSSKIVPHGSFRTLRLVPVGHYPDDPEQAPPLMLLAEHLEAFFSLPVAVEKCVPLSSIPNLTTRINGGVRQLLIKDLYRYLGDHLSRNRSAARTTLATVAVTMEDVYPGEEWNFVFGQASLMEGLESSASHGTTQHSTINSVSGVG